MLPCRGSAVPIYGRGLSLGGRAGVGNDKFGPEGAAPLKADGEVRDGGEVCEVTGLLDLPSWPTGMRVILRRERPHPGAPAVAVRSPRRVAVPDGWRYQAFAINTTSGTLQFLEARHRAHARVEDRIRHAKDSGLGRFPSREFGINQTWLTLTMIAADLVAWLKMLVLDGDLAKAETKALRYRLLHVPSRLVHGARRRRLRLPKSLALGRTDRGRVRPHRCDPSTSLTNPPEDLENRSPAASAGQQPRPHPAQRSTATVLASRQLSSRVMKERG
ncbi:putative transposase [Mycobacteroides abscessus subsp. abscessus]|nr:putative transposase [Mycobacteroides abscessus subsp. abscessus]